MMIWDYIRDFLVQYIFGGTNSLGDYFYGCIGGNENDGLYDTYSTLAPIEFISEDGSRFHISIGDWLSTTTTIIIMCLAVFLMIMLVRWVWRLVTSAFLLK